MPAYKKPPVKPADVYSARAVMPDCVRNPGEKEIIRRSGYFIAVPVTAGTV